MLLGALVTSLLLAAVKSLVVAVLKSLVVAVALLVVAVLRRLVVLLFFLKRSAFVLVCCRMLREMRCFCVPSTVGSFISIMQAMEALAG